MNSLLVPLWAVCQLWKLTRCGLVTVIWCQGSGSTLAQVMAYCLTAPSHYLNQCWLVIGVMSYGIHPRAFSWDHLKIHTNKARMKFEFLKSHPDLPEANELMGFIYMLRVLPYSVAVWLHPWWISCIDFSLVVHPFLVFLSLSPLCDLG